MMKNNCNIFGRKENFEVDNKKYITSMLKNIKKKVKNENLNLIVERQNDTSISISNEIFISHISMGDDDNVWFDLQIVNDNRDSVSKKFKKSNKKLLDDIFKYINMTAKKIPTVKKEFK